MEGMNRFFTKLGINLIMVVCLELILYFLWFLDAKYDLNVIGLVQIFISSVVIPGYSAKINHHHHMSLKKNQKGFSADIFLTIIVSMIGIGWGYLNWGLTTGYLKEPDNDTLGVIELEIIVSLIITVLAYLYHKKGYRD